MSTLATVITGASSGIGEIMARDLAAEKQTLILVARRADLLARLADELRAQHGITVHCIAQDLEKPNAANELMSRIKALNVSVDMLVNNAGFGINANVHETDEGRLTGMLMLNMVTLTELCRAVLPEMVARKKGRILNVGSLIGFQATPRFAGYSASKAYVITFTEALAAEVKPFGVHVSAVCPGATKTAFHEVSGNSGSLVTLLMDTPENVSRTGINAVNKGKALVVAGLMNKPLPFFVRLLPRGLMVLIAGLLVKPPKA